MLDNLQRYNKGIIALLAPALVAIGARYGLELSAEEAAILASLVTGVIVILVPNKTPDKGIDPAMAAKALETFQAYLRQTGQAQKDHEPGAYMKRIREKGEGN